MRKIKIEGGCRVTDAETGTNILCPLMHGSPCMTGCVAYALQDEVKTATYVYPSGGDREDMRWFWQEHTCCAMPGGEVVLGITGDYPTDDPLFKRAEPTT